MTSVIPETVHRPDQTFNSQVKHHPSTTQRLHRARNYTGVVPNISANRRLSTPCAHSEVSRSAHSPHSYPQPKSLEYVYGISMGTRNQKGRA